MFGAAAAACGVPTPPLALATPDLGFQPTEPLVTDTVVGDLFSQRFVEKY